MDSLSHTRVAKLLLAHVEERCGVTFDETGFLYGNLKPDLTGTYLTKRHYPSLMYDEVMEKLRTFLQTYIIGSYNGYELSVDLGEICHYLTDFFCYPHNDDIYDRNLLMHYIYEKRICLGLRHRLNAAKFSAWADPIVPAPTIDELESRIEQLHHRYKYYTVHHCIENDIEYITQVVTILLLSVIQIAYAEEPAISSVLAPCV